MDGREAMAMSGPSSQYYIHHRGIGGGLGSVSHTGLHGPPGIRTMPNPGTGLPAQSFHVGGASTGLSFRAESQSPVSPHGADTGAPPGTVQGEPVKRKRGRPRKYGPDGTVSTTLQVSESGAGTAESVASGLATPTQKRGRGRPPGTGTKQKLASLGEWVAGSAGMGFTPHIITIAIGEDIATKIMSFSQQGPRAVCILSANGAVSTVTLRQPTTSGGTVTYEGRFEILCMSGSYLPTDDGGSRSRSGGLSISLSSSDGRVIGGGVGGLLVAASPVQVIVGSFIYGGSKAKNKSKNAREPGESEPPIGGKQSTPTGMIPSQNLTPPLLVGGGWAGSRPMEMRNSHIDIDLMRE